MNNNVNTLAPSFTSPENQGDFKFPPEYLAEVDQPDLAVTIEKPDTTPQFAEPSLDALAALRDSQAAAALTATFDRTGEIAQNPPAAIEVANENPENYRKEITNAGPAVVQVRNLALGAEALARR